jgi:hypothetical protein
MLHHAQCTARLDSVSGETHLLISWYSPDHDWLGNTDDGFSLSGTLDWTPLAVADYPPVGAAYGRVGLRSDGAAGTAYFRDARVWVTEPREAVALILPEGVPGAAAHLRPISSTPATYALVRPASEGEDDPGDDLQEVGSPTPSSDGALRFAWGDAPPGAVLAKRFERPPSPPDEAMWEPGLVDAFLRATRWLLPIWVDGAASEMFGGRDQLVSLVRGAGTELEAADDNPEHAFAQYLADLWTSADPESLRQRSHELATRLGTLDIRCDQVLYLQAVETARVAGHCLPVFGSIGRPGSGRPSLGMQRRSRTRTEVRRCPRSRCCDLRKRC